MGYMGQGITMRRIVPKQWNLKPTGHTVDVDGFAAVAPPNPTPWFTPATQPHGQAFADYVHYRDPRTSCGKCDTDACNCVYTSMGAYSSEVLELWGLNNGGQRVSTIMRTFYGALALGMRYPEKTSVRDYYVRTVADTVYRGLMLACTGEARYDVRLALTGLWAARVKKRGSKVVNMPIYNNPVIRVFSSIRSSTSSREGIADPVARTVDVYDPMVSRTLRNIFLWAGRFARGTGASYGGLMWASCAQLAYDWRAGRLTDIEFVDRVFDARHNGAPVLTKVFCSSGDTETQFLTIRSEASLDWLIRWTPNSVRAAFGESPCVPLPFDACIRYSLDGVDPAVVPDDKNAEWVNEQYSSKAARYLRLDNPSGGENALMKTMIKRVREDERFFLYSHHCECEHGCDNYLNGSTNNLNIEHDCDNVCTRKCYCRVRIQSIEFSNMTLASSVCSHCGSDDHMEDDCSWCENCEEYGHYEDDCPKYDGEKFWCADCGHNHEEFVKVVCADCGAELCSDCVGSAHHCLGKQKAAAEAKLKLAAEQAYANAAAMDKLIIEQAEAVK